MPQYVLNKIPFSMQLLFMPLNILKHNLIPMITVGMFCFSISIESRTSTFVYD